MQVPANQNNMPRWDDSIKAENLSLGRKVQKKAIKWSENGSKLGAIGSRLACVIKPIALIGDVALHVIIGLGKLLVCVPNFVYRWAITGEEGRPASNWTFSQACKHAGFAVAYFADIFASPLINLANPSIYRYLGVSFDEEIVVPPNNNEALNQQIVDLQAQANVPNNQIAELNQQIANLNQQIVDLQAQANVPNNQIAELNQQIVDLQAQANVPNNQIAELNQRIVDLNQEIASLQARINDDQRKSELIDHNKKIKEESDEEIENLKRRLAEQTAQYLADLKVCNKIVEEKNSHINKLKEEIRVLEGGIESNNDNSFDFDAVNINSYLPEEKEEDDLYHILRLDEIKKQPFKPEDFNNYFVSENTFDSEEVKETAVLKSELSKLSQSCASYELSRAFNDNCSNTIVIGEAETFKNENVIEHSPESASTKIYDQHTSYIWGVGEPNLKCQLNKGWMTETVGKIEVALSAIEALEVGLKEIAEDKSLRIQTKEELKEFISEKSLAAKNWLEENWDCTHLFDMSVFNSRFGLADNANAAVEDLPAVIGKLEKRMNEKKLLLQRSLIALQKDIDQKIQAVEQMKSQEAEQERAERRAALVRAQEVQQEAESRKQEERLVRDLALKCFNRVKRAALEDKLKVINTDVETCELTTLLLYMGPDEKQQFAEAVQKNGEISEAMKNELRKW